MNPGTGRAYLVSGSFNLYIGKVVNLDDPNFATDFPGLNLVTFVNSSAQGVGGALGTSVAGGNNIFGDGASDIILGAPSASVAPPTPTTIQPKTGVVYVISTAFLSGGTQTIDVSTLGNGSNTLLLSGVNQGDQAGLSVADAGDVNGVTAGGKNVDDLLIGAPQAASSAGAAYLVYGGTALAGLATTTNTVRYINLSNVGGTGTNAVPGAIFTGPAGGSETGFAVSSAGDFNNDGFGDIVIGTPQFSSSSTLLNQGEASIFYGATLGSTGYLTGTIPLANVPTGIQSVTLTGANSGDMAGYAVSPVGFINVGQPNPILIGSARLQHGLGHRVLDSRPDRLHGNLFAGERRVVSDLGSPVRADDAGLTLDLAQLLRGIGVEPVPGHDLHRRW